MTKDQLNCLLEAQRDYFTSGATLDISLREQALQRLSHAIQSREGEIAAALKADLGKGSEESYLCEIGMVLSELRYMKKHLRSFAAEKTVKTPLAQFAAHSFVKPSPYGVCLIMSPWNYPFLLTIGPLIDCLAAGNTAIIKPSAYSPATSAAIERLIGDIFPADYVTVITGGREENALLLDEKFDHIFFTGSKAVGSLVLEKAARHLTPVTLELGGKSPCIVDKSAKLSLAARRIVFGKYLNCGQTCVAPDYILCHRSVKDRLIALLKKEILRQYGEDALSAPDYGHIVNERHFNRLMGLIDVEKLQCGGKCRRECLQIQPTVLADCCWEDPVMQEEIFGPILPILTYDDCDEVITAVNSHDKPLAFYVFAEDQKLVKKLLSRCQFGGGCVNDCIIHLATSEMGFGGVGESGMGAYHGKAGFDAFSHKKSIVDKKTWIDLPMRYRPYDAWKTALVRMFLK